MLDALLWVIVYPDGRIARLVDWLNDGQQIGVPDTTMPTWSPQAWSMGGVTPESMLFDGNEAEFTMYTFPDSIPRVFHCRSATSYTQACWPPSESFVGAWAGVFTEGAANQIREVVLVAVYPDQSVARLVDRFDDGVAAGMPDLISPTWTPQGWSTGGLVPEWMDFDDCRAVLRYNTYPESQEITFYCVKAASNQ